MKTLWGVNMWGRLVAYHPVPEPDVCPWCAPGEVCRDCEEREMAQRYEWKVITASSESAATEFLNEFDKDDWIIDSVQPTATNGFIGCIVIVIVARRPLDREPVVTPLSAAKEAFPTVEAN